MVPLRQRCTTKMRICAKAFKIILSRAMPLSNEWWYYNRTSVELTRKGGNLAAWCLGVSFGVLKPRCQVSVLVSWLLKNRFQFCLRTAAISGFQFWFNFYPRKLFYFEYGLFKCFTAWRFCFITMVSGSSRGRVRRAML